MRVERAGGILVVGALAWFHGGRGLAQGRGGEGQLSGTSPGGAHTVQEGDTLWGVSEQYYGDPYAWPRLWSYNPDLDNPHYIYPGDVLRLGPVADDALVAREQAAVGQGSAPASRRAISRKAPTPVLLREQAYLDADALPQVGVIVGSGATHMLLSQSDELYVEFEEPPREPVGRELSVFRHVSKAENSSRAANVYHYDPEHPGEMVRVLGTVRVIEYDPETQIARAEVVEALDVIERGFRVADVPRRFVRVPPKTNATTVESTVVAAMRPVELVGQNQVVYIGAGSDAGVLPGNRFFVIRREDGWRRSLPKHDEAAMGADRPAKPFPDEGRFPNDIIGELLVLHTRPASATAIVTHTVREITPGDRVRMPDGY